MRRFGSVVRVAVSATALVFMACGAPELFSGDAVAVSSAALAQTGQRQPDATIAGRLQYGETSALQRLNAHSKDVAFSFVGRPGDDITITVKEQHGNTRLRLLDQYLERVAVGAAQQRNGSVQLHTVLTQDPEQVYWIVVESTERRAARFTVTLERDCSGKAVMCAPGTRWSVEACGCAPVSTQVGASPVGTWKVVSVDDQPTAPDTSAVYILGEDRSLTLGCGKAPGGTWELLPKGTDVSQGFPVLRMLSLSGTSLGDWVVTRLTADSMVYYEGGDQFVMQRDTCPAQ